MRIFKCNGGFAPHDNHNDVRGTRRAEVIERSKEKVHRQRPGLRRPAGKVPLPLRDDPSFECRSVIPLAQPVLHRSSQRCTRPIPKETTYSTEQYGCLGTTQKDGWTADDTWVAVLRWRLESR